MSLLQKALGLTTALACVGGAYAKLDLKSDSNVVVYWGMHCNIMIVIAREENWANAWLSIQAKIPWEQRQTL